MSPGFVVIGTVSDDPFAIDVAHYTGQNEDVSDILSCKSFANTEFCPRFISDETDFNHIGSQLSGKTVVIVSTCCGEHTRNALAMRTFLLARGAKDNGAENVILVEPDLYYSAQDRGPRPEHGEIDFERTREDYKKFDGQPFSSMLYADLLKSSGVDRVITAHNHSVSVENLFRQVFKGDFFNLSPAELYTHYLLHHHGAVLSGRGEGHEFVICAPDKGAVPFVKTVYDKIHKAGSAMLLKSLPELLLMDKERRGERTVSIQAGSDSPIGLDRVKGREVIVFDDMVRTGSTIVECCNLLKRAGAIRVIFVVTHFHSSSEVKENLNSRAIDDIITTNTLPTILNRDMQGRLRKKMLVLKIEKWIARFLLSKFSAGGTTPPRGQPYSIDVSAKNPLWEHYPNSQQ